MNGDELNQLIKVAREAAFFIQSIDGYENSKIANELRDLSDKVEGQKFLIIGRLAARVVYRNAKKAEVTALLFSPLVELIESMRLVDHYECEGDTYYSCPMSPDYQGRDDTSRCNCGLIEQNHKIDEAIKIISRLMKTEESR